ncbi:unnamed protein product [Prorocentrum cordatum]|uniref:Rab-GAP TBC domain-containing protein n=1 Tax=Prorocentrum cordatum TaxID=2364126 RepID=A0ABN9PI33_9DINO|nr:unnamed protein product [Polarella glacialis]
MLAAASAGQGLSPRGGRLLGAADADAVKQIDLDMPRTAGGDPLLSARLSWVRAMLMRQLAEDPDLGYCQGMNLVAAIFGAAAGSYVEERGRPRPRAPCEGRRIT